MMRKFKADYINLILFISVTITLISIITTSKPSLTLDVILILVLVAAMSFFFIIIFFKDYSNIELNENVLRIRFILRGKIKELHKNDIEGIVFQERSGSRVWRSWKEIVIKTRGGDNISLSKEGFFNFYDLEKELKERYSILVPLTGKILTDSEREALKRKNYYSEVRETRKYLIVSIIAATIFILFSISGASHSKGWTVIFLIGIYFLYSFIKNVIYFKKLKKGN